MVDVPGKTRSFLQICLFHNFEEFYPRFVTFLRADAMSPIQLEFLLVEIPRRKSEIYSRLVPIPKLNFHNLQFWNAVKLLNQPLDETVMFKHSDTKCYGGYLDQIHSEIPLCANHTFK